MATIKVPYVYTSYSFSPKATRISKRMAKGKMSWGVFTWFLVAFAILILVTQLVDPDNVSDTVGILLALVLPICLASVAAYFVEKLRTRVFEDRIRKALEEDLAALAVTQPELAAAYRIQLASILMK